MPIGRLAGTWLLQAGPVRLIVKRLAVERDRDEYVRAFLEVAVAGVAPDLVAVIGGVDEWYVIVHFVDGRQPTPADPDWGTLWSAISPLLATLARSSEVPQFDILDSWVTLLGRYDFGERNANEMSRLLFGDVPAGRVVLAHGDVSPQNVVLVDERAVLIDWAQAGRAPLGFDAGWFVAHAEARALPRSDVAELSAELCGRGLSPAVLRWFVRFGFLRLLWRTHTLPIGRPAREALRSRFTALIEHELASHDREGNRLS